MLSRPPALNESDNRGRGPVSVTPRPVLPLADQTGVFSSTTWKSSLPLPPPFSSSPTLSTSSSSSAAPLLPPHSILSSPSSSFICHPPPVSVHQMYLSSSPPSSSASEMAPSLFSSQPLNHTSAPPTVSLVSSASLIPSPTSSFSSPPLTSTLPAHSSVSPSSPSSSSPGTLSVLSLSSSVPPHLHSHTSCLVPSPPSDLPTPHTAAVFLHLSPSSVHTSPPPVSPLPPCPVAPPPACSCSSLLPRLFSAHRLEMRRLLRGALASLGRRLDALERRSRTKKRKKGGAAVSSPAASTSCSSGSISCSSSLDSEQSHTPAILSCLSQSEHSKGEEFRSRKRRRKNREDDDNEDEDPGRFVGQMAVSFTGGAEDASLTLHNVNVAKRRLEGGTGQTVNAVSVIGQRNGYREPLSLHSSAHLFQSAASVRTCSQSKSLFVLSGQWWSADSAPSPSSNPSAFSLWLHSSSSSPFSFRPASFLRLSTDSVETLVNLVRDGACGGPLRPLKDWTAPPSLSGDHCYVQTPTQSSTLSTRRQQKQRASRGLHLPRRRPLALPPCSANGLSTPFPAGQSAAGSGFVSTNGEVELGKRVSQIRIRRASPKETLLTPMGLPKVKRLKKKEFSLEEIYTNKNFNHHPTTNRSLETIFEEPREKDGALLLIGQQRRRRLLLFPDFTQPRKRKRAQGTGLPIATLPRKRATARRHCHGGGSSEDDLDLDVMLVERLSALEHFLTQQGLDV